MPTYEYACRSCGHVFEIVQSMHDASLTECPRCGGELRKVFAAPAISFKGSGFYATDHRKNAKHGGKREEPAASGSKDGEKKTSSSKDSKKESSSSSGSSDSSGSSSSSESSGSSGSSGSSSSSSESSGSKKERSS